MTNPKLALIPSGYKSGKVYSILPNDGTQDFSLDRDTIGTRVRKDGLIEEVVADTPRLDYTNSDCPAMLRECQRTNLYTYSESFSNIFSNQLTVTDNSATSPQGNFNASSIIPTTTNTVHYLSLPNSSTGTVTFSVFAKANGYNYIYLHLFDGSNGRAWFNINEGIVGTTDGTISADIKQMPNGWYKCIITRVLTGSLTQADIAFSDNDNVTIFAGDGTSGVYIFGAQLEAGLGSTSYIKTEGTIQTRDLDNLECTTTYTVGNDATWFFDFEAFSYDSSFRQLFLIRNSGFTQYLDLISYESGGTYYMRSRVTSNGGTQNYIIAFGEDAILNFTRNKVAIRLYGSNFEIYVNGTREYTGTASAGEWDVLNGLDIVNDFGSSSTSPSYRLYDFRVYDQTMTQSELEELTT